MLIIQELLGYFLIGIIGMAILAVCYLPIYFIMRKRMPLLRQIGNRQISRYIDAREIMEVAEHNGKFCSILKHGRKGK